MRNVLKKSRTTVQERSSRIKTNGRAVVFSESSLVMAMSRFLEQAWLSVA